MKSITLYLLSMILIVLSFTLAVFIIVGITAVVINVIPESEVIVYTPPPTQSLEDKMKYNRIRNNMLKDRVMKYYPQTDNNTIVIECECNCEDYWRANQCNNINH